MVFVKNFNYNSTCNAEGQANLQFHNTTRNVSSFSSLLTEVTS